jgi:hypothetical protein
MVDSTGRFNEAVTLNNDGFITIGSRSGWSAAFRVDAIELIRDPAGDAVSVDLWGTWARETLEPNTTLRIMSSERFAHDGSLSLGFIHDIHLLDLDYCDEPTKTYRCFPLGEVEPGYGWLDDDGGLYYWDTGDTGDGNGVGSEPGTTGGEDSEEGPVLGSNDTLEIDFPADPDDVIVATEPPEAGAEEIPVPLQNICEFFECRGLILAIVVGVVALLLLIMALLTPSGVIAIVLAGILIAFIVLFLVVSWLCRCWWPSELGTGPPADQGTDGSFTIEVPSEGEGGEEKPGSGDDTTTTTIPTADGTVVLDGANTGGQRVKHVCYPQGHGSHDWDTISRRGGSTTQTESWTVPASAKILQANETYELRVHYTAMLKVYGSIATPLGAPAVVVKRFKTGGPPNYPGALENYIARVYPYDGARPVYTGYDLSVTFTEDYVPYLYASVGEQLVLRLFDGQGNPLTDEAGNALLIPATVLGEYEHTVTEQVWLDIYQRSVDRGCVEPAPRRIKATTVIRLSPKALNVDLTRNSQYRIHLVSDSDPATPLAQWAFTTSRYDLFTDLVTLDRTFDSPLMLAGPLSGSDFDTMCRIAAIPTIAYVDRFAITPLLDSEGVAYVGLLFESPEPLDFNLRLSVSVNGSSTTLIGNVDNTRGFVLPTDTTPWALDDLDVVLTWRQDAGPDLPRLTVDGTARDETVGFTISPGT